MNILDVIVCSFLVWAAYRGFVKGLIIQIATFAALLLGVWGAIKFSDMTAAFMVEKFEVVWNNIAIISFAITFIIIVIGVHFVANIAEKLLKAIALGLVNQLSGLLFSIIKMTLVISIVSIIFLQINVHFNIVETSTIKESMIFKPISEIAPAIFPYFKAFIPPAANIDLHL
ncbi:CvpA family protein [Bacteroidales bacterium]|nr:CvpA family protein [Bacteroidales bacterium]